MKLDIFSYVYESFDLSFSVHCLPIYFAHFLLDFWCFFPLGFKSLFKIHIREIISVLSLLYCKYFSQFFFPLCVVDSGFCHLKAFHFYVIDLITLVDFESYLERLSHT